MVLHAARRARPSRVILIAGLLAGLACGACGADDGQAEPVAPANPLGSGGQASVAPHWDLTPVPTELLDRVQEELGSRAGVRVVRVQRGGAADRAGVRDEDVLLAVDSAVVESPGAATQALRGRTGEISLTLLRIADDGAWSVLQIVLAMPAPPTAPTPAHPPAMPSPVPASPTPPASPASPTAAPTSRLAVVIEAYFDMLDFARTEGWGRKSATPEALRRHAEAQLQRHLPDLDAQTRATIEQIPEAWSTLRTRWAAADEGDRRKQRTFWKTNLLLPNPLLPLRTALETFRSEAGGHAFEHPADWVVAQGRADDTGLLYLGPAGTQTTWEVVVDPATSPPGVVFAISPTDEGLRAVDSPEEGTRYVAQNFVTARAPDMREVAAFRIGMGALVAYVGRWPGSNEESFCWVAAMPFGNDKVIAGRFSGPVSQAETLLPAFSIILATTEVTPPDDAANLQVELAASIIGNAVINTGWSH